MTTGELWMVSVASVAHLVVAVWGLLAAYIVIRTLTMMVANGESLTIVWMRCPYDADICGADASLREFEVTSEGGWTGILECSNGHVFRLTQ